MWAYKGEWSISDDDVPQTQRYDVEKKRIRSEVVSDADVAAGTDNGMPALIVPAAESGMKSLLDHDDERGGGIDKNESGNNGDPPKKSAKRYTLEEQVDMFRDADKNGYLAQSYVGNWWKQQLKTNPELKAEFETAGKKMGKAVKARAVAAKLSELEETYEEQTTELGEDLVNAEHLPFSVIVQREGGDEEALEATKEYVKTVVGFHNAGKTGPRKKAWVQRHFGTKRVEYLYVRTSALQKWLDSKTFKKTHGKASYGGRGTATKGAASGGAVGGGAGLAPKAKAKVNAGGNSRAGKHTMAGGGTKGGEAAKGCKARQGVRDAERHEAASYEDEGGDGERARHRQRSPCKR